ncbi:thioredoxin family protein [Rubripirellula amarantea]|uniref:Thioredoxin-dependent thiol peroxidase n=1 Tax=Rubripirellula amarantea TaxID=2527999 RepID=A0A5C5WIF9_9BACT|nr:thioredoxin family protein [Rubripirellula amarantea]MDA8743676.1 thioredoxin family protein [Rubripirellula amarantea]TWT49791.1 thioredoxin-dependent thiol peroxidase [Rubripirellula amarantea]
MIRVVLSLVMFTHLAFFAVAGEFNSVLSVGDQSPKWEALPSTSGRMISSDDLANAKVVVIAFTCNSCPYAVDVEDRLIDLHRDFKGRSVTVVAANVNTIEEDSLEAMKQKAEEKGFEFEYLYDESQQIAKDFGAKYTPQFFVIGPDRKIAYMGSFDDSPDGKAITQPYVRDAVAGLLEGKSIAVSETVPIGCRIRMERRRRSRTK